MEETREMGRERLLVWALRNVGWIIRRQRRRSWSAQVPRGRVRGHRLQLTLCGPLRMAQAPRRVRGGVAQDERGLEGRGARHEPLQLELRLPVRMAVAPSWIRRRVARGLVDIDGRLTAKSAHA